MKSSSASSVRIFWKTCSVAKSVKFFSAKNASLLGLKRRQNARIVRITSRLAKFQKEWWIFSIKLSLIANTNPLAAKERSLTIQEICTIIQTASKSLQMIIRVLWIVERLSPRTFQLKTMFNPSVQVTNYYALNVIWTSIACIVEQKSSLSKIAATCASETFDWKMID